MKPEFVHTHVHSDFSLLDSSVSADDLARDAAAKGMRAMALTDHGNVMGHVPFFAACKKAGIKPILGCELYVARRSATEPMDKLGGNPTDHLVVMAENEEGYGNLLQLVTWANINGLHYVPRVDLEVLARHSKGLVAQTACLSGGVNRLLNGWEARNKTTKEIEAIEADFQGAMDLAMALQSIFGKDNFFLEIQHHAGAHKDDDLVYRQRKLIDQVIRLHKVTGIPLVATNDIHFRVPEDAKAREIALYISRGKSRSDTLTLDAVSHSGEFYVKSPDEMQAMFPDMEIALKNTLAIAERCNVNLELGKYRVATPIVDGKELTDTEIQDRWERLLEHGFHEKYEGTPVEDEARERLDHEKKVIEKMGFVPYFLMVSDFVSYALGKGWLVGDGRGSAGGCLIANVLDITNGDPLEHGLIFERFLNSERISMPDIDVDFPSERVPDVLAYLTQKYGADRVARIGSVNALWAKGVIREVGKLLDFPPEDIEDMANAIPKGGGEFQVSIGDAIGKGDKALAIPKIQSLTTSNDPKHREFIEICERLEGIKRSRGTHACGVIIGSRPLIKDVALTYKKGTTQLQTDCDMKTLETLGLLKVDLLSLASLGICSLALEWIERRHGKKIDFRRLTFDDPATYDLICSGRTLGMFQIETPLMRPVVMRIGPRNLEDLSVIIALNRPGPLDFVDDRGLNMVDHYILRRLGKETVSYLHPKMEAILKPTYGVIVYQEQIMQIARALCGFSNAEADSLRKSIGKKLPELIAKEGKRFVELAMRHSEISEPLAQEIWSTIETFARYGFNKAHSIGYARQVYKTAWLKTHYPVEYMSAVLTYAIGGVSDSEDEEDDTEGGSRKVEKIAKYIYECNQLGIPVYDPDVTKSEAACTPEGEGIRAGLRIIKDVGDSANLVVAARHIGQFTDFHDFIYKCCVMGVTMSHFKPLIAAGAVPFGDRNTLLANVLKISDWTRRKLAKVRSAERKVVQEEDPTKKKRKTKPRAEAPPPPIVSAEPMSEMQERAESIAAIGTYLLPRFDPSSVAVSVDNVDTLMEVISLTNSYPGRIKTYARVVINDIQVDWRLPSTDGSEELSHKLRKIARVLES
ncbi:MAG: DNA polymerase III subunit alpha [Hyphomicrobiaceae bacterium]|nr:MAG: DNA polymerase III subunit alpha [Hyphomicrobiaceae bacterium]